MDSGSTSTLSPSPHRPLVITAVGLALFGSGAAGLINQVVWQRALKVFLGGSEAICSTIVVLVFMAGLGAGSIWMSGRAARFRNPLRAFGCLEGVLAIVNLGVCLLLSSDVTDSVFQLQKIVTAIGVPLLGVYALLAGAVLLIPCLLMGATMPLAAESLQRNLGLQNSRLLGLLFFVNTAGSVLGTIVSGGWMMAHLGLSASLVAAVALNALAGVLLLITATKTSPGSIQERQTEPSGRRWSVPRPNRHEIIGFGLGFCSLAFEMFLFRLIPLRHHPLPYTFAAVLGGFLLFWSLGAALSSRETTLSVRKGLVLTALACLATIPMFAVDDIMPITGMFSLTAFILLKTPYFLPCILFGFLFARVAADAATSWGRDVGRFYAWNTAGSCLGVLATTFVGYEIPVFALVAVISLLIVAIESIADASRERRAWRMPIAAAAIVTVGCLVLDVTRLTPGQSTYSGRDGVVVVHDDGNLIWDGLWHSRLSRNNDHIGTHNWNLAVAPVWCHSGAAVEDVCVIGVGTGITASTLARLETVRRVDAYDISHVLEEVFERHPAGTLHLRENDRIRLILQDARTGLALNPQKYDIIQTQPLYLKQAGSALLNSVEFMQLVQSRLKRRGVFCVYSNGTPEQAFALRETADAVFRFRESFFNGYLLILSNDPIHIDAATLDARLSSGDPLWSEIRGYAGTASGEQIMELLDRPRFPRGDGSLIVTDDRPIIEYPDYLSRKLRRSAPGLQLPRPVPAHLLRSPQ